LLLFDLLLFALLVLAARSAVLLHELLGHACPTLLFGGQVRGIRVSLFGGGKVYHHFENELSLAVGFVVAYGGILVNLLSGALALGYVGRMTHRPLWSLFLALFAMISLLGAVAYSALGFYYDQGDPVAWLKDGPPRGEGLWIPFLLTAPLVSGLTVGSYLRLTQGWFPAVTVAGRLALLLATLGISGGVYAGLYRVTGEESVALEAPAAAHRQAVEQALRSKRDALHRRLRELHPQWTEETVQKEVDRTPVAISPDAVPRRFPLKALIAFLYALGGFWALRRGRQEGTAAFRSQGPLTAGRVTLALLWAGAVIGLLAWSGGWLLGAPPKPG
jgi:hypothetical protein